MGDVASAIISHEQTQSNAVKLSMLFSDFGCFISKGTLFRLFRCYHLSSAGEPEKDTLLFASVQRLL